MKDQILKVTFPDGIDCGVNEINFTTTKEIDGMNAAAGIIATIGEFPAAEITFDLQEADGREYHYPAAGEDAASIILEYFSEWHQQKVLRLAIDNCSTIAGGEWIAATSYYDPDWTEEF